MMLMIMSKISQAKLVEAQRDKYRHFNDNKQRYAENMQLPQRQYQRQKHGNHKQGNNTNKQENNK